MLELEAPFIITAIIGSFFLFKQAYQKSEWCPCYSDGVCYHREEQDWIHLFLLAALLLWHILPIPLIAAVRIGSISLCNSKFPREVVCEIENEKNWFGLHVIRNYQVSEITLFGLCSILLSTLFFTIMLKLWAILLSTCRPIMHRNSS